MRLLSDLTELYVLECISKGKNNKVITFHPRVTPFTRHVIAIRITKQDFNRYYQLERVSFTAGTIPVRKCTPPSPYQSSSLTLSSCREKKIVLRNACITTVHFTRADRIYKAFRRVTSFVLRITKKGKGKSFSSYSNVYLGREKHENIKRTKTRIKLASVLRTQGLFHTS